MQTNCPKTSTTANDASVQLARLEVEDSPELRFASGQWELNSVFVAVHPQEIPSAMAVSIHSDSSSWASLQELLLGVCIRWP